MVVTKNKSDIARSEQTVLNRSVDDVFIEKLDLKEYMDFTSSTPTGTIQASLESVFNNNPKNVANTSTTTINTTTVEDITATVQWDNALSGNTLTITQGSADIFGVQQA